MYHDESGERFQEVYRSAVTAKKRKFGLIIFWFCVIMSTAAMIMVRLYLSGAIVGLK